MKNVNSFRKFVPCLLLIALAMMVGAKQSHAYPAAPGCDNNPQSPTFGCHFDIRNTEDNGNGSLRLALAEGCSKAGNHLVEFSRYPSPVSVIKLKGQLNVLNSCQGTFNFAGMISKEVIIDGTDIPRSQSNNNPDGKNCALYLGTGNHQVHNLTFVGAPNAVCVYGDNVKVTDNNFGIKRDGTVQGNVNGLFINRNQAQVINNVFAGNEGDGLILQGHRNLVQQNYLGVTASDRNSDKGNGGAGIRIIDAASQNIIGYAPPNSLGYSVCTGDCSFTSSNPQSNSIRFNKKAGVILSGTSESTRNTISGNEISGNTGLGIDLNNDGPSLPLMGAVGPNNMMPIATQVQTFNLENNNPTSWYVVFKAPLHAYYEVYKIGDMDAADTNQVDAAGKSYGEGQILLARGQVNVLSSNGLTGVPLANPNLQIHNKVSILLRDEQGNTSEFSANIEVSDQPVPPVTEGSCGDGVVNGTDQCDDGTGTNGNGSVASCCDATCHFKSAGTDCNDGTPGKCTGMSNTCGHGSCGDGIKNGTEDCDDGMGMNGNGSAASCCDATCHFKTAGTDCNDGTPGKCTGASDTCNHTGCGNGTVDMGEDCEPTISGECCSATCTWIAQGSACRGGIGICDSAHDCCGDGIVGVSEACDDGGNAVGDGCDATCNVEPGWTCTGEPSVCNHTCGNGVVDAGEECDPMTSGTCCNSTCHWITPGSACSSGPGVCDSVHTCCGDGSVQPGEGCDDGNNANGDGCSSVCATEPGFVCTGSPSHCTPTTGCGDSIVQGTEQCDGGVCCNPGTCTFKTDGTVCNDSGGTCLTGVCSNTNPGGGVVPPGFSGPMSIEGGGFCSLNAAAGDSNALTMVVFDFIGAASIGLFRFRKSRKK